MPTGPDPSDPSVWWRALVDAVIAYRRGDKASVAKYLRFVEAHRGRTEAVAARDRIKALSRARGYQDIEQWPARDYNPRPK